MMNLAVCFIMNKFPSRHSLLYFPNYWLPLWLSPFFGSGLRLQISFRPNSVGTWWEEEEEEGDSRNLFKKKP
jgi:hypothetical protein